MGTPFGAWFSHPTHLGLVVSGTPFVRWTTLSRSRRQRDQPGLDSHAPMPALALLLPFGLALGALLPQLPELLRIVEQTGDALLAHPEALPLALPCQGCREVPVVVFKQVAHPRERRAEAFFPERDVIQVDAVIHRVVHESLATAHRKVGHVPPCVVVLMVVNRHAPLGRLGRQRLAAVHLARHELGPVVEIVAG